MTQPYREPAPLVFPDALRQPRGLVRSNGSHCTCSPPGWLWCWWYSVKPKDRWFCGHGGAWFYYHDASAILFRSWWEPLPPEGDDRG